MIRIRSTACIDAPASRVWSRLCALEEIPLWSAPVLRATCPLGHNTGIGAQRICALKGNLEIRESWSEWSNEQRYFKYEAEGIPLVKRASNRGSVHAHSPGQSLLISEAEVELQGGGIARLLLEPLMEKRMIILGQQSLAALKHLVETGHRFEGKYTDLPVPLHAC